MGLSRARATAGAALAGSEGWLIGSPASRTAGATPSTAAIRSSTSSEGTFFPSSIMCR
ncbi:hypothetical protein [Streptomyces sp. RP5T]|uniref:hypothetical protein n=1 Tax=Streptomyces sp. RP5T TaxID=2490848 RepID=UPI0021AD6AC0|nr:hypothetical protein [Streptomyces sp. RP5T]